MTTNPKIAALLALADQPPLEDEGEADRLAARIIFTRKTVALLREAQDRATEAWTRLVADLPEDMTPEQEAAIEPPPEETEVQEIREAIRVMTEDGIWPRELYWGGL